MEVSARIVLSWTQVIKLRSRDPYFFGVLTLFQDL